MHLQGSIGYTNTLDDSYKYQTLPSLAVADLCADRRTLTCADCDGFIAPAARNTATLAVALLIRQNPPLMNEDEVQNLDDTKRVLGGDRSLAALPRSAVRSLSRCGLRPRWGCDQS